MSKSQLKDKTREGSKELRTGNSCIKYMTNYHSISLLEQSGYTLLYETWYMKRAQYIVSRYPGHTSPAHQTSHAYYIQ